MQNLAVRISFMQHECDFINKESRNNKKTKNLFDHLF